MEGAFGADFSGVRVHSDAESDSLNEGLSARAFTTGQDVFIRREDYSPDSTAGQELIAHELTHVVQQGVAPIQRIFLEPILSMTYPEIKAQLELTYTEVPGDWVIAQLAKEGEYSTLEQVAEALKLQPKAQGAGGQPEPVQGPASVVNAPEKKQAPKAPSVPTSKPWKKNEPSAEPTPTAQPKDYGDPFLNQLYEDLIQIKNPTGALDEGKRKIGWKLAWRNLVEGHASSEADDVCFYALTFRYGPGAWQDKHEDDYQYPEEWKAAMKPLVNKAAAWRKVLLEDLKDQTKLKYFKTKEEVTEFIRSCAELAWLGKDFGAYALDKINELNAEMLKGHGLDKSDEPGKGLEPQLPLMNREEREQDALGTAAIQVSLMGKELDTKAVTEPAPQSEGDWDYFYAADLVDQLEGKLGEANEQLTAARDPKADEQVIAASNPDVLYPRAEKAIHGTARRLKGIVEGKYPNRLKVYAKLIASGVAAAVKTAIASGALELGKLVKGKHLGKGAGGEVWEYSYLEMKQKIAGKETLGTDIENENVQEALKAESDLQSALPESRNLLAGLGDVEAKGRTIAFMELAGGGDVKAVIEEMNKPEHGFGLAEKDLIMRYILKGTLEGLEALHKFGMVHGDIKPGNIFLDENLNPVLADFGESHMQGMGSGGVGTAKYMAPEVVKEQGSFRASDIWAVGEMLLLALTGRNSIRYILGTDVKYLENEEFRKGDITDEELAAKLDEDHSESGITEAIASFAKGALTQDQGERMTATEGLAHQLLQDVDDEGAKMLIRQLLDAIAGHK